MNEYKIEVASEAESKEAQELFFEMGYAWNSGDTSIMHLCEKYLIIDGGNMTFRYKHQTDEFKKSPQQQITLPELRTLAILKRNDVDDATHVDKDGSKWFICGDGYYFFDFNGEWYETSKAPAEAYNLKPIQKKETEMSNLISGKEAKLAWANDQEVQVRIKGDEWVVIEGGFCLAMFDAHDNEFRLKPQTITVTLELPKPFKPEIGDKYWFAYPDVSEGYSFETCENDLGDKNLTQFGAYRTEEEIKQVVEAMRKAFGGAV